MFERDDGVGLAITMDMDEAILRSTAPDRPLVFHPLHIVALMELYPDLMGRLLAEKRIVPSFMIGSDEDVHDDLYVLEHGEYRLL